jgi:hypothetical protein
MTRLPLAPTTLLAALGVLSHATPCVAQRPFAQLTTRAIETVVPSPGAAATGDIDGDGDPDLLIPSVTGQDRLFRNNGDGLFQDITTTNMPPDSTWTHATTFADVDRDGDLDAVLAGNSGYLSIGEQNRLLINNGSGVFVDATAARMPIDQDKTVEIAAFDADADGDVDLYCLNEDTGFNGVAHNRLYLNDGTGRFTNATGNLPVDPGNYCRDLEVADLDRDGDVDVVTAVALGDRPLRVYLNDGAGRFSMLSAGRLPPVSRLVGASTWPISKPTAMSTS